MPNPRHLISEKLVRIQVALLAGVIALGIAVTGLFFQYILVSEKLDELYNRVVYDSPEAARIEKIADEPWKMYINDTIGFTMQIPSSWIVTESTPSATSSRVYTNGEADDFLQYREYQTVVTIRSPQPPSVSFSVLRYTDYSHDLETKRFIESREFDPEAKVGETGIVKKSQNISNVYLYPDPQNPIEFTWWHMYGTYVLPGYVKSGDAIRALFLKMLHTVRFTK